MTILSASCMASSGVMPYQWLLLTSVMSGQPTNLSKYFARYSAMLSCVGFSSIVVVF